MNSGLRYVTVTLLMSFYMGTSIAADICYYCSPETAKCDDPVGSNLAQSCSDLYRHQNSHPLSRALQEKNLKAEPDNMSFVCITIHVVNETDTGIDGVSRMCFKDDGDVCDTLLNMGPVPSVGNIVKCHQCKDDLCNNEKAVDFLNSAADRHIASVLILMLFCRIFSF